MVKIILSIIFALASVLVFTFYTKGAYAKISDTKSSINKYQAAVKKAQLVLDKIDQLTNERASINAEDLGKLAKMVPETVDNIQLILDIEGVTKRYNIKMQKVNISKSVDNKKKNKGSRINVGAGPQDDVKSLDVSFDVIATYDDFIRFIVDLEHSLRLVDFVEISLSSKKMDINSFNTFESGLITDNNASSTETLSMDSSEPYYTFNVVLRTYWLNNVK